MADLKLTVAKLRELAREHLGSGHSKLKTKEALLEALRQAVPHLLGSPGPGAPEDASKRRRPVKVVSFSAAKAWRGEETQPSLAPAPAAPAAQPQGRPSRFRAQATQPASPVTEGFFAPFGQSDASPPSNEELARRGAGGFPGEVLGELPVSYGSERAVLLPRDPTTLFFFWDLPQGRSPGDGWALLALYEDGVKVREADFALSAQGIYLHGLKPGHRYRAELFIREANGYRRALGMGSNEVELPLDRPSLDLRIQTASLPFSGTDAQRAERMRAASRAWRESKRVEAYEHVDLPSSSGWRVRTALSREGRETEHMPSPWPRSDLPSSHGMATSSHGHRSSRR